MAKSYRDLDIWQNGIKIVSGIYNVTRKFPKDEMFGITSQLRRASVSIVSNLSEGLSRNSKLDTRRFLKIARSSLVELDSQIEISLQLKFCTLEQIK